jgi:N-acyl-D-amino-acid deacylase
MPHVLTRIKQARDRGLDVTADIYPYIAGSTALSACLPPWALEGGTEKCSSGCAIRRRANV